MNGGGGRMTKFCSIGFDRLQTGGKGFHPLRALNAAWHDTYSEERIMNNCTNGGNLMSDHLVAQPVIVELPDNNLPNPDHVSYYALEKERKIYLDTGIGPDNMCLHRMILRWNMEDAGKPAEERKPIKIYIMSYGGDLDYMWAIVDIINTSKTPVYTINVGVAASAASLIFISGHKRIMMPSSKVIIHEGSAQMAGDAVKVMDATDSYRKELKRMKEYILSKTRIPQQTLIRRKNNDWTINADYCLENGVCDMIAESVEDIL